MLAHTANNKTIKHQKTTTPFSLALNRTSKHVATLLDRLPQLPVTNQETDREDMFGWVWRMVLEGM